MQLLNMGSLEKIVKFNAQTVGREKLLRLCQYTTKFVTSMLHVYHQKYSKRGTNLLELLYKLRELEQYFISCRRLISFGRCTDQFYSAAKSMQLSDPIIRMTSAASQFLLSLQMFTDHILWLDQMGFLKNYEDKQLWIERANRFWMYSAGANLLRDFYEIICVVQRRTKSDLDNPTKPFTYKKPIKWMRENPELSCDLIKNTCDFCIPYTAINKLHMHSSMIAMLGIISTTMGILQVYDRKFRLSS